NPIDRRLLGVTHQHIGSPVLVEIGYLNVSEEWMVPDVVTHRIAQSDLLEFHRRLARVGIVPQRWRRLRAKREVEVQDILKLTISESSHMAHLHDLRHARHHFSPALPRKI